MRRSTSCTSGAGGDIDTVHHHRVIGRELLRALRSSLTLSLLSSSLIGMVKYLENSRANAIVS